MRHKGNIDAYVSYFEQELTVIFTLPSHLYRKILAVGVIDTLGRVRHPNVRGNRERFLRTVEDLAGWPEMNRVSLPQLLFSLKHELGDLGTRLALAATRRLAGWPEYHVPRISLDPMYEELSPLAQHSQESRILLGCRHLELLYTYRNVLVHEFREPGYDMGVLGDDPMPYYFNMEDEQGVGRWELAYPTNFFVMITTHVLKSLQAYLEAEDIDPYALYRFGSMWRPPVGHSMA